MPPKRVLFITQPSPSCHPASLSQYTWGLCCCWWLLSLSSFP
jgi:hypothetical protein